MNASQGFCGYALMFVEDESPERASGFYAKGEAYAARALKGAAPAAAKKSDVPPLFWNTFCKALYINLNRDKPEVLAELPTLEPAIEKLLGLDPSYYHNGAHGLMGAYYSLRPRMFGGDPDKAKSHFELALKGAESASAEPLPYAGRWRRGTRSFRATAEFEISATQGDTACQTKWLK